MSIERPFLQVPYESLHMNYRQARLVLDQELKAIAAELSGTQGELSAEQAADLRSRLSEVVTKLEACRICHAQHAQTLRVRTQKLMSTSPAATTGPASMRNVAHEHVGPLVAAYLADTGRFPRTLDAMVAHDEGLRDMVDWDLIVQEKELIDAVVRDKDYERGLRWCRHNRGFLTKHGLSIEFRLQMLRYEHLLFVEHDLAGAVEYARKAFAKADATKTAVLQRAAGALYGEVRVRANEPKVVSSALDEGAGLLRGGAAALEAELRTAFRVVHGRGHGYILLSHVAVGLAALKTRQCGHTPLPAGHELCPACAPLLLPLVDQVPGALHTTSVLDDDLVALPTGNVMGLLRLSEYTLENWPDEFERGLFVDPVSHEPLDVAQATRVFAL